MDLGNNGGGFLFFLLWMQTEKTDNQNRDWQIKPTIVIGLFPYIILGKKFPRLKYGRWLPSYISVKIPTYFLESSLHTIQHDGSSTASNQEDLFNEMLGIEVTATHPELVRPQAPHDICLLRSRILDRAQYPCSHIHIFLILETWKYNWYSLMNVYWFAERHLFFVCILSWLYWEVDGMSRFLK
jgi:hypothetical protein